MKKDSGRKLRHNWWAIAGHQRDLKDNQEIEWATDAGYDKEDYNMVEEI